MSFIVSIGKSTAVSKIIKMLYIFFRYFEIFLCSHLIRAQACIDVIVYIFAINRYHTGCIFGLFHSSLNFKGIHSIFDQFRDH